MTEESNTHGSRVADNGLRRGSRRLRGPAAALALALLVVAALLSWVNRPMAIITFTATPTNTATATVTATDTSTATGTPAATLTSSAIATLSPKLTATSEQREIQAKIEVVWPHDAEGREAPVRDADLANVTAYLIAGPLSGGPGYADPPPCDWEPKVWLWSALNAEPARPIALGQKRLITTGGRTFPVWDFNNVDVSPAREPANKLAFFVTVEGVLTRFNIWTHAADARTLLPTQDIPTGTVTQRPLAIDAKIEIVWPQDNLPVTEARLANITAYLFERGSRRALSLELGWLPTVRLHRSLNTETEAPGTDIVGLPRVITAPNGVQFLAWDFNNVDVSAAQEPLNKIHFWVSVDGVPTYSNIWSHGADARTIFPQVDMLNSCH